jgi:hypothetical protein
MIIDHPSKEALAGEFLIYEHVDGVVYARFRDEPKKSLYAGRWIIGGNQNSLARAKGYLGYDDWKELFRLADQNVTLRKQLDKTLDLYYIIRNGE